jgi:hypothetical protein
VSACCNHQYLCSWEERPQRASEEGTPPQCFPIQQRSSDCLQGHVPISDLMKTSSPSATSTPARGYTVTFQTTRQHAVDEDTTISRHCPQDVAAVGHTILQHPPKHTSSTSQSWESLDFFLQDSRILDTTLFGSFTPCSSLHHTRLRQL